MQVHEQAMALRRAACREVVHEVYGEASTYYFHRLGKPPLESQLIYEINDPATPGSTIKLSEPGGTHRAATVLADFYDAATAGLFTAHPTAVADQMDSLMSSMMQQQQVCSLPTLQ